MHAVSLTALWTAAQRARESSRPDRLVDDPLAETLAGPEGVRVMKAMEGGQPPSPVVAIRTRYFDDRLVARTAGDGLRQVVLIGAGMDTRAFRLDLPPDVTMFELDLPEILSLKALRLAQVDARPTCQRRVVPCDLGADWIGALFSSGYSSGEPSVFIAEGLLMYFTEPDVHRLLSALTAVASPGSSLLADVCGRSFRDAPLMTTWFATLERAGMGWRYATHEPEVMLAAHGWQPDVVCYGDERAHFGRWQGHRVDRTDLEWPHSYLVEGRLGEDSPSRPKARPLKLSLADGARENRRHGYGGVQEMNARLEK